MKTLIRDKDGESSVWWSWQDLRNGVEKRPPSGGFCTHGRAWLHLPRNSARIEWHLFGRSCGISIDCADTVTDDDALDLHLAIPFLFSIWFSIRNIKLIERLPGVNWEYNDFNSGRRTISLSVHSWSIWWRLWRNPHVSNSRDWRDACFHIDDSFLGRNRHERRDISSGDVLLIMQEGAYPAKVTLFESIWKRPRWPWHKRLLRAEVEVEGGVPIPGKGENSWDMGDDAIFLGTYPAATVEEALNAMRESAMRDRKRYAGEDWVPDGGWPAHCLR